MEECLQDRREGGGFSARCRHAVEARMERQAADFQLNYGLRWGLACACVWVGGCVCVDCALGCVGCVPRGGGLVCGWACVDCVLAGCAGLGGLVRGWAWHAGLGGLAGRLPAGGSPFAWAARQRPPLVASWPASHIHARHPLPVCARREYCADDIEELCKEQAQQIAMAEGYGADSQVIACLEVGGWVGGTGWQGHGRQQDRSLGRQLAATGGAGGGGRVAAAPLAVWWTHAPPPAAPLPHRPQTQRERITSKRCREGVHRQMEHEAEDIRFDHQLAKACHRWGTGGTKVGWAWLAAVGWAARGWWRRGGRLALARSVADEGESPGWGAGRGWRAALAWPMPHTTPAAPLRAPCPAATSSCSARRWCPARRASSTACRTTETGWRRPAPPSCSTMRSCWQVGRPGRGGLA